MSSVDNLLRTVNEYMTDMFNTFGGQSTEYMTALQQYRDILPEAALDLYARQGNDYPGDTPDAPAHRPGMPAHRPGTPIASRSPPWKTAILNLSNNINHVGYFNSVPRETLYEEMKQ